MIGVAAICFVVGLSLGVLLGASWGLLMYDRLERKERENATKQDDE